MRSLGHAFVLGLVAASIHMGDARAETWPVGRHDAARTGASSATSPIENPYVTWRAFMGGRPNANTVQFGIQNQSTLVAAVGGRFMVKDAMTQATAWKSDMLGIGAVEGIADLDGDKFPEIIVRTETSAHVLDGKTGAVVWSSAPDAFRTPAAIRVVDLDGNKLPDVYIDECTSCAKQGTMSAGAYSFANGFAQPKTLWERPKSASPPPVNSGSDAIVDLDDDGFPEVVLSSGDKILVVRGTDGGTIATLSLPTSDKNPFPHARAIAAQIDGFTGKELVILQSTGQVATSGGPTGVTVFRLDPKTGINSMLYRRVAGGYDESMVTQADVVSDLDGDGLSEVIFSHRGASNPNFTTEILSGVSGIPSVILTGARFEGAANLDDDIGDELILATQNGLSIHKFIGGQLDTLAGPVPNLRVQLMPDEFGRQTGQVDYRAGVLQRPGMAPALLVGLPSSQIPYADLPDIGSYLDIRGMALSSSGLDTVGIYVPLVGEITGVIPAGGASRPYPQVAIGTTAGTVVLLSQSFQGTNGVVYAGGQASGSLIGGATQPNTGARSGPLIGTDEAGPFVVLPDSPLGLFVGDARNASLIVEPNQRWVAARMGAPSIMEFPSPLGSVVVGADGQALVARGSISGAVLGQVDLGLGTPHGTPLPLQVAGSNAPLVGIDWRVDGVQIVQHAVDFMNQTDVWQGKALPFGGFFASGVADLNNDGTDEWYSMNDGLNRRDALSGAITTIPGEGMGYTLPMMASFTAGGQKQLLLQGGGLAPKLLDSSLKQVWQSSMSEPVNGMGGTRVMCGTSTRFFTPSVLSPMLRAFDGATGALVAERALAGGAAYSSLQLAEAAGKRPGVLSNATSVAKLGIGNGAVLVGSTDGYLYAVDACSLDLRWAKFLGGSVAEPIVGDTDGDAGDEIMVGVADGHIVNIDNPPYIATDSVAFVGPKNGAAPLVVSPGEEVKVSFESVAGATSYEVALVGPDDQALWSPAFREASGNLATVSLDGALAGRPYRVAIRAKGPEGNSPEVFSPTVTVEDRNAPSLVATAKTKGNSIALDLKMKDDLALDHWIVWMKPKSPEAPDSKNGQALVAAESLVGGKSADVSPSFEAPEELHSRDVVIIVEALDSAGNSTNVNFNATIDQNGFVSSLTEEGAEPLAFGGCSAASNRTAGTGGGILLGLAMMLLRRSRRRPN